MYIIEAYGINMIEISVFLSEVVDSDQRYVVREYNEDKSRVLRTRVVATQDEAESVKLEWSKR